MKQRGAVFLDRDGVLNQLLPGGPAGTSPQSVAETVIYPDVPAALARLRGAGFLLIVTTNQPDVSRGKQTRAGVESIHAHLAAQLPLDGIEVCYHDDADRCACRKPKPGLIRAAAQRHGIHVAASYMIGDRWRDIDAGLAAGCTPILIERGHQEELRGQPAVVVSSLAEAAAWIEEREGKGTARDSAGAAAPAATRRRQ
ncbi:MAG TPA: HAD family hydrolase [Stellaceae bacterium]|nr:HAD family hydrolase [Stellaceae bacterium]